MDAPLINLGRPLTPKERMARQIAGLEVDRVPCVGGWMHGVPNLAALAGVTVAEYLADPPRAVMAAYRALGVDAITNPIIPQAADEVRTTHLAEARFAETEPEALLQRAAEIPDTEAEVLARRFDAAQVEAHYRGHWERLLGLLGEIALLPTHWEAPANFQLYFLFGYVAFLEAVALYPDAVERIFWEDSVMARARNGILARLYREYDVPPLLFCGHDICINTGPMCSVSFLRERYWPHARYSLEPLVDAGIRLICHCDGNVMPLIDDQIAAGFSGFQGFQYECGVDPWLIGERRSARGEELLFMAGMNVTRTLPFGTPEEVIDEVDYCLDYAGSGRRLFFFSSSSIGPEVPLENTLAGYRHAQAFRDFGRTPRRRPWPFGARDRPSGP